MIDKKLKPNYGESAESSNFNQRSGENGLARFVTAAKSGPNWAPWSAWSSCSSQCLRGESQARHRACLDAEGNTAEEIKPCIERGRKANVDIRVCACNRYGEYRVRQQNSLLEIEKRQH